MKILYVITAVFYNGKSVIIHECDGWSESEKVACQCSEFSGVRHCEISVRVIDPVVYIMGSIDVNSCG